MSLVFQDCKLTLSTIILLTNADSLTDDAPVVGNNCSVLYDTSIRIQSRQAQA